MLQFLAIATFQSAISEQSSMYQITMGNIIPSTLLAII